MIEFVSVGGFAGTGGDDQARRQQRQVLDVLDAGVLEQLLADDIDHDGHVLETLLALLSGDDDLADPRGLVLSEGRYVANVADGKVTVYSR